MTTTAIPPAAEAALEYAQRGWAPLPYASRTKNPNRRGWQKERWTEDAIRARSTQFGNVGVILGQPSGGLVDIDLDCSEAISLAATFLPSTAAIFGRGSRRRSHQLYVIPDWRKLKKFEDPGLVAPDGEKLTFVEFRSDNGQTVFPGSTHESGESITWDEHGEPARVDSRELYSATAELAAACLMARYWPGGGKRHGVSVALAGVLMGLVGWDEAKTADFLEAVGIAAHDEEARKRRDNARTTQERIETGQEYQGRPTLITLVGKPVVDQLLDFLLPKVRVGNYIFSQNGNGSHPPNGTTTTNAAPTGFHLTDLGNAERLVHRHGASLHYVYEWKSWLYWDGKRWKVDNGKTIEKLAKETVRAIYTEAAEETDDGRRTELVKHAKNSEKRERIAAMIALAQSEDGIPVEPGDLDADLMLLNCQNGTVDLRTGELLSHQRDNLITKLCPVSFDAAAQCPLWLQFLEQIMDGKQRLIGFLQRAFGYTTTGDASEQVLFMLHGLGANGKSTFLETSRRVLGDYAQSTEFSTFLQKDRDPIRNDLARLVGVRFASAIEADAGRRLSEVVIKQVTGGDPVTARFLFREFFEFVPVFKLWLACNHRPVIVGTDEAIWRRIRLIPFTVTIPEEQRDPKLLAKLRKESAGILTWIVQGCIEWQRNGLQAPAEVRAATQAYREESDVLGSFIAECCVLNPRAIIPAAELYAAYLAYCQGCGETPVLQKTFGMRLSERGLERKQMGHAKQWHWLGIGVLSPRSDGPPTGNGSAKSTDSESTADPCGPCGSENPETSPGTAHEETYGENGPHGSAWIRMDAEEADEGPVGSAPQGGCRFCGGSMWREPNAPGQPWTCRACDAPSPGANASAESPADDEVAF